MEKNTLKYQKIVDSIYSDIKGRKLRDGDKLDSENEIGEKFRVSRQTVRHALAVLEEKGILDKRQGSGNYIVVPKEMEFSNTGLSKTITVVSTYLNNYIFPRIISEIEGVLREKGYSLRIVFTHNHFDGERAILERLLQEEDVGGLIIEPTKSAIPNLNRPLYYELLSKNIPMMFFHSYYESMPIPHVSMNDVLAGEIAAEHLIEQGHRKIGGIFKMDDGQGPRRYEGYARALSKHGIHLDDRPVIWIDTEEQKDLRRSADIILKRLEGCSGCVCYNDEVAYSMVQICMERGIRVPEDFSITGIDNSDLCVLSPVHITSVEHPMEKLGRKVAEQFLRLLENPREDVTYEFTPKLVSRDSVCRYRKNKN